MKELLSLQFTIFVLLAVGFLVKKIRIVGAEGQRNITDLVIYVVLPCNIVLSFLSGMTRDTLRDCLTILLISIGIQVFGVIYGKLLYRNQPEDRKKSLTYAIICSNAGFLGNPIAEGVFGATGLMYASVYLIPQRIMMWSEGLAIFSGEKDRKGTLKKVVTHPCVIACVIGIILMLTGAELPELIKTPLSTIGRCNTALSMFVIGMILADIDLKTILDRTVVWYTVNRLVIIPLLVYGVCLLLPVSSVVRGVSVLLAAMPAGATTSMLALKYGRDPGFATRLVVFSTLCSIPAIMIWSMILK
ncbi:MAG: AEC family transporter [Lachnospiraceae bacterium]|nr:AEC family transporter [Lachnospiraceae bacterium]